MIILGNRVPSNYASLLPDYLESDILVIPPRFIKKNCILLVMKN